MGKLLFIISFCGLTLSTFAQRQLFNGKDLQDWDIYIGTPIKGFEELKEKSTPESIYSVVDLDGQKGIRISGEVNASIATKESFENYHLRLEFKWGNKVYSKRNSGLLYHSFGKFGEAIGTWMPNIEHQLMHNNLGDTYLMNNTYCETVVTEIQDTKNYKYSNKGNSKKFGEKFNGHSIKKSSDQEVPIGKWNTVDLYCFGRTAIHVVNGKVVMINKNCGTIEPNGEIKPLTKGKIQIQSEGGELFVRKVEIEKIDALPNL